MRFIDQRRSFPSSLTFAYPAQPPIYSPARENLSVSNPQSSEITPDVHLQFLFTFQMILARLRREKIIGRAPTIPSNVVGVQKQFRCDFENGWCRNWNRNKSNELQWEVNSGPTYNPLTGPDVDHTLKTADGKYAYFNGSLGVYESLATFYTPPVIMKNSPEYCLSFWYHMRGIGVGTLKVFWKFPPTRANRTGFQYLIFSKEYPTSLTEFDWKLAEITLYSPLAFKYISPVSFKFQASKGIRRSSDIALDDISLVEGACNRNSQLPTVPSIGSGTQTFSTNFTNGNSNEDYRFLPSENIRRPHQRCGSNIYNPLTHSCCANTIGEGVGICCGRTVMVHPNQVCCDGQRAYIPGVQQCCNGTIYSTLFYRCCNGQLILKIQNCG